MGRVDVITGTFGKARAALPGGFTTGKREIIDPPAPAEPPLSLLQHPGSRRGCRHAEMPGDAGAGTSLRDHLEEITVGYRQALKDAGFDIIDGTHPCVPIMLYDEHKAARMAQKLYELGIYAVSSPTP